MKSHAWTIHKPDNLHMDNQEFAVFLDIAWEGLTCYKLHLKNVKMKTFFSKRDGAFIA
jgi:hypothetical protein